MGALENYLLVHTRTEEQQAMRIELTINQGEGQGVACRRGWLVAHHPPIPCIGHSSLDKLIRLHVTRIACLIRHISAALVSYLERQVSLSA
jgi:hypothetical protein